TWSAARFGDDVVKNCIAAEADRSGIVLDPHTAVGVLAGRAARRDPSIPLVALATAHPAKFPDAVEAATGVRPELPDRLADLHDRPERLTRMPNDLVVVQEFVEAHRRVR
ncbi:MAG: threonine synthase, partial [Actinomycetota bacterium]|nr:threonine synthase [Actinomycetota bacterium]